jgi:hypothetical protein
MRATRARSAGASPRRYGNRLAASGCAAAAVVHKSANSDGVHDTSDTASS